MEKVESAFSRIRHRYGVMVPIGSARADLFDHILGLAPAAELGVAATGIRVDHDMTDLGKLALDPIMDLFCDIVGFM